MDKNLERKRITIIEEASLAIKKIITSSALNMIHKSVTKEQCNIIIKDTQKKLEELKIDNEFIQEVIRALKINFLRWYNQMVMQLEIIAKKDESGLVSETLKAMKNIDYKKNTNGFTIALAGNKVAMEQVQITNLRELMTIYDEGAAGRYVDYVGKIKESLIDIQDSLASNTLSLYDSQGRKKSIRNMAEIKTRYDLINEDLTKLKEKGTRYVVASAHANASERCSWWQGKIFLIDIDIASREMGQYPGRKPIQTILGHIDGKPYYSLKQACENGFLSYNCQHRVIAYYKGVHIPTYNLIEIKKKRDITQKQRYLENKIRQQKSKQVLAISPEERKKAQLESKRLQAEYRSFCEVNNVPRYDWRCRVTEVERNFSPRLNGGYVSEELHIVENSDIIKMELLCVKKDVYIEPMPTRRFNKIKAVFEKKGGLIIQDDDAQRYLTSRGADAITLDEKTIVMKPNPTASEVFEEFIHVGQFKRGEISDSKSRLICEIKACKKLIANQKVYGITDEEHKINQERLAKQLKELEENYD